MSKKRDEGLLLEDILICSSRIIEYTANMNYSSFLDDQKTMDAVFRNFEIIGEASSRFEPEFRQKYTAIPWVMMKNLRNKLIHDYTGIDYEIIWDLSQNHLEELQFQVKKLLAEIDSQNSNKK